MGKSKLTLSKKSKNSNKSRKNKQKRKNNRMFRGGASEIISDESQLDTSVGWAIKYQVVKKKEIIGEKYPERVKILETKNLNEVRKYIGDTKYEVTAM